MHNPVQSENSYYELIKESCECLQVLDDELISPEFFDNKLQIVLETKNTQISID